MKSAYIICFMLMMFCVVPLASAKEIERGTIELGGGLDLSLASLENERQGASKVDFDTNKVSALILYYIAPNLALGLEWEYESNSSKNNGSIIEDETVNIVAPSISYNFSLNDSLSLKLIGSIAVMRTESASGQNRPVKSDGVGGGGTVKISYFVADNVSFDAGISYVKITLEQDQIDNDFSGFGSGIGISVYFN